MKNKKIQAHRMMSRETCTIFKQASQNVPLFFIKEVQPNLLPDRELFPATFSLDKSLIVLTITVQCVRESSCPKL